MSLSVILIVGIIVMMASLQCDPCYNGCCDKSDNLEEMLDEALKDAKKQLNAYHEELADEVSSWAADAMRGAAESILEKMIARIKQDYHNFEYDND